MIKKTASSKIQPLDIIAFMLAAFYTQSVLTVAHHISQWPIDEVSRVAEAPAVPLLVAGLILCAYSWYKKRSLSTLIVIALTVFATASLFWLSGLRTNFY